MKSFSAQYIFTNTSVPLKRGIVSVDNDGTINEIEDTNGDLKERRSVDFREGIIIPGFINCHCHLELSHMKGSVPMGTGLGGFISQIRHKREVRAEEIFSSAATADLQMQREGIVMCADICNTPITFDLKRRSSISYINLLEVFGLDPDKASKRIEEILKVASRAGELNLPYFIVPHSTYSLSLPLFRLVKELGKNNGITSIHFMETGAERDFIEKKSGELVDSYFASGIITAMPETGESPEDVILKEVTASGNIILVHNTFAERKTVESLLKRKNSYWCLCPSSNIHITGHIPPADMFYEEGCEIVVGTDSLASNSGLSILKELKILQDHFTSIPLEVLIRWATMNGAKALNAFDNLGSIEAGKKPGLLLLENVDLRNMKILPETCVKRLI